MAASPLRRQNPYLMNGVVQLAGSRRSHSTAGFRIAAVPPQAFFAGSAIFHYLGPSFAVLLFARVDVLGVAWMRIAAAAAVFALWRRPWRAFAATGRDERLL